MTEDRIVRWEQRRTHLAQLSDAELKDRFWAAIDDVMSPVVDLARTHTSPSIERSVLMRMGVDSVTCHPVVDAVAEAGLLAKGAGHVVVKLARERNLGVRAAADLIAADASVLTGLFEGK